MKLVLAQMPQTLQSLQSAVGAKPASYITLSVVARDTTAKTVLKSTVRALLVAGMGGPSLTVLGTTAIDALLRRRSRKRQARKASRAR